MARPVGADAELTKQRVLGAAAHLFADKGEGQTSMRQIAGEAGVSLGTVHHYFGSKAKLYEACIEAMYAELGDLRDRLLGQFESGAVPRQVVDDGIRSAFRFVREHQSAVRLIMRDVVEVGEVDPGRRARFVNPSLDHAVALLQPILGGDAFEVRLTLQSFVNVLVRYAISTEAELSHMAALPERKALAAVEDHLVKLAWTMTQLDKRMK